MILCASDVLSLCNKLLLRGIEPEQLEYLEGSAVNLRIGRLFKFLGGHGFIGVKKRLAAPRVEVFPFKRDKYFWENYLTETAAFWSETTGKVEAVPSEEDIENPCWFFKPGVAYPFITTEEISVPDHLIGVLTPRVTWFESGLGVWCSDISNGYDGTLLGTIHCFGAPMHVEQNSFIMNLRVYQINSTLPKELHPYRGKRGKTVGLEGLQEAV